MLEIILWVTGIVVSYILLANFTYGWHKAVIIKRDQFFDWSDQHHCVALALLFPIYWIGFFAKFINDTMMNGIRNFWI